MKKGNCKHFGYLLKDGKLICADCGEPSPSEKWRDNVFGANAKQGKGKREEEK
ncbi:MAG: hypothetical protein AAB368_03425 [bacterium]